MAARSHAVLEDCGLDAVGDFFRAVYCGRRVGCRRIYRLPDVDDSRQSDCTVRSFETPKITTMPANPKYLTASRTQRFAKISAGILGGYCVSMSILLALAAWLNHTNVIISGAFAGFILWVTFML